MSPSDRLVISAEDIERVRSLLPPPEVLWQKFLELMQAWGTPDTSVSEPLTYRESEDGHSVKIGFGATEWFDYVASDPARALKRGTLVRPLRLHWSGVLDELGYAVRSGYPWLAIRDYQIVALHDPSGPAWPDGFEPGSEPDMGEGTWWTGDPGTSTPFRGEVESV